MTKLSEDSARAQFADLDDGRPITTADLLHAIANELVGLAVDFDENSREATDPEEADYCRDSARELLEHSETLHAIAKDL